MDYAALSTWCNSHKDIPDNDDEPFVVSYNIKIDEEETEIHPDHPSNYIDIDYESFRIFIST